MHLKSSIKVNKILKTCWLLCLWIVGCTQPPDIPTPMESSKQKLSRLIISSDSLNATIIMGDSLNKIDDLRSKATAPVSLDFLMKLLYPDIHDSTRLMYSQDFLTRVGPEKRVRRLNKINNNEDLSLSFAIDTAYVFSILREHVESITSKTYVHHLFNVNPFPPSFDKLIPSEKLALPIDSLNVPSKASRLPNAPRSYRSGTHRGIDFFSNWGTPVRSVADGIVIRSDRFYKEVPAEFRREMLQRAATLNRTPSDIFNELLLGQAVIVDHGFSLFKGYRSITIYAHLSSINENIIPGYNIKKGEIFAQSGNSGTEPSTLGTRRESHLHWELILQDQNGEYYFGQNLDYEKLMVALKNLFND